MSGPYRHRQQLLQHQCLRHYSADGLPPAAFEPTYQTPLHSLEINNPVMKRRAAISIALIAIFISAIPYIKACFGIAGTVLLFLKYLQYHPKITFFTYQKSQADLEPQDKLNLWPPLSQTADILRAIFQWVSAHIFENLGRLLHG